MLELTGCDDINVSCVQRMEAGRSVDGCSMASTKRLAIEQHALPPWPSACPYSLLLPAIKLCFSETSIPPRSASLTVYIHTVSNHSLREPNQVFLLPDTSHVHSIHHTLRSIQLPTYGQKTTRELLLPSPTPDKNANRIAPARTGLAAISHPMIIPPTGSYLSASVQSLLKIQAHEGSPPLYIPCPRVFVCPEKGEKSILSEGT